MAVPKLSRLVFGGHRPSLASQLLCHVLRDQWVSSLGKTLTILSTCLFEGGEKEQKNVNTRNGVNSLGLEITA